MAIIVPLETVVNINFPAFVTFFHPRSINIIPAVTTQTPTPVNVPVTCQTSGSSSSGGNGNLIPLSVMRVNGLATGIAPNSSATVASYNVPFSGAWLTGIQASGDANGSYLLLVNGIQVFRFTTNSASPQIDYKLPGELAFKSGNVVSLQVVNTGIGTSDYFGNLLFTIYPPATPPSYLKHVAATSPNVPVGGFSALSTFTVLASSGNLSGIQASGDDNGVYFVNINNVPSFRFMTNILKPDIKFEIPGSLLLNVNDIVSITVTNTGSGTASYSGTLLGVF